MSKFDEIEHVLFDYPVMKVNLEALADAADSYDCSFDKVRVSGGDETSRVEKLAIKRADYARYVAVVDAVMATMPGIERDFIRLHYFTGLPMKDVADSLHCAERTLFDIRNRALGRFVVALGWGKRHPAFLAPVEVQGALFGTA